MTDKNTTNKYDVLFESGAEFAFRIDLCKKEEIEGADDDTIEEFCEKRGVTLPPVLWSHTRHFGKKARARDSDYNCTFSMADYDYAIHQASLREEWHEMMNLKEILDSKNFKVNYDQSCPDENDGLYTPEIKSLMNIDNMLPFYYDAFTRSIKFVDSSLENPCVYSLTRNYGLASEFTSFTNIYRNILFLFIVGHAPHGFAELGIIDNKIVPIGKAPIIDYSEGYEWLKKYQDIFKSDTINRPHLKRLREQFYVLNEEVEIKENRILSFSEFENKFIEFLEENNFNQ